MRLLRPLLAGLVLALSLVVVTGAPSFACRCAGGAVREYVDRADVVVTGTVTDVEPPPRRPVMSSNDPVTYTVAVDRVYAGGAAAEVAVLSEASSASCGLEGVRAGGRYVVFAAQRTVGGEPAHELWANLCGGTGPATPRFVAQLEAVTGPGEPPGSAGTGPGEAAYSSDPDLTFEEPAANATEPARPEGGALATPVAFAAGAGLVLLAGALWLRLLLRR